MKDRAFPAFDLNCTIHYTFTHQLKTVPFWHGMQVSLSSAH